MTMTARQRGASRRRHEPNLDRDEILQTALRLVDQHGLEALSLRSLASELKVTPAAVHWHVRSKDELLKAVVNAVFTDFTPPPCTSGTWTERIHVLFTWFRITLLNRLKVLGTPTFRSILPYAFMKIGTTSSNILQEAGFAGLALERASRTLYFHAFGWAIFEALLFGSFSPTSTPKLALERAVSKLRREDLPGYIANLPRMLDFDVNELFDYSLDRLLDGLGEDLEVEQSRSQTGHAKAPAS
jgi:AcrR family transcriptional regulator